MGVRAVLMVWRLSLATRWQRLHALARKHKALALAILAGVFACIATLAALGRSAVTREALASLVQNEILVGVAASLYALLFVARRLAHAEMERRQSWLIAVVPTRTLRATAAIRVGAALAGHTLLISVVLLALGLAHQHLPGDVVRVVIGVAIGAVVGGLSGGAWPRRMSSGRREDSRFVRRADRSAARPSFEGLSRWPVAKAIAWHRPENSRLLFIIAALSVPMGASALLGVAILTVWTLGSYLLALARAVPSVAREASIWLRPTSLPFASFAWAVARRALAHQFIGAVLLGTMFVSIGGSVVSVGYFAALWLMLVAMIAMIGLRQSYLSLPSSGRTLLAILVVVAAESRVRGWGLPLAAVLTLAHMRGVARGRA
jgi:hypothetical protein